MKKIYSICTCGCSIEKADLVKNNKHQNSCPEHGGTVISRFTDCGHEGCDTIRHFARGGVVPEYCVPHQNERDVERRRKFTREYYHLNKKKFRTRLSRRKMYNHLRDDTRLDCSCRFDCLGKYDKFDTLPCKGCKDYNSVNFCDDAIYTNTNFNCSTRF